MLTLKDFEKNGIYFYLLKHQNDLCFLSLSLAEGLKELNFSLFCNKESNHTHLVRKSAAKLGKTAICIVEIDKLEDPLHAGPFIDELNELASQNFNLVLMSAADNVVSFGINSAKIPFLATHEISFYQFQKGNRIPWAFGMSNNTINQAILSQKSNETRKKVILRNFTPSENQSVRLSLDLSLVPLLEKHFQIDRSLDDKCDTDGVRAFSQSHFAKLNNYFGCLSYGGILRDDSTRHLENKAYNSETVKFIKEPVILRWDSYRFWESLLCRCLTFHLDFEKYGFVLPVMPKNWVHYVGFNLENLSEDVNRLLDQFEELPSIAENGQRWALENYSPVPTAYRFLEYMIASDTF